MYIAISGNIGSGKTSLTEVLSQRLGFTPCFEDTGNPYIGDFYEDMERWAFNLQVYFLNKRLRQLAEVVGSGRDVILDRTIYEDAHIFAANLHDMGLMSSRDYETYRELFSYAESSIRQPDLLIYLKAGETTLVSQIHKRGRAYEMSISEEYLSRLNARYRDWIGGYTGRVLTVDVDTCDFVMDGRVLDDIVAQVERIRESRE